MWQLYLGLFLVAGLAGLGYLYKMEIESHGVTKAQLTTAVAEIDKIRQDLDQMKADQAQISEQSRDLQLELNAAKRELDQFRGRESTVLAKPGLVERLINKSFNDLQNEIACATGDKALCSQ